MRDFAIYSPDKSRYAVAINKVLFTYVRPVTEYKRSEIVPTGKPIKCKSFDEAKRKAKRFVKLH